MPKTYPVVTFDTVEFNNADIREATVTESFNPMSITLPISTLELLIFSEDADFSLLNPAGAYASLEYQQPLVVNEMVDGTPVFIGRYYLDTWENVTENLIKLNCVDELGVMDSLTYRGGVWLSSATTTGELITEMLGEIDVDYEIDPDLVDIPVNGWLPICTYREALQQIAFACGAYVLCARQSGFIKIGVSEAAGAITRGISCGVSNVGQSRNWMKRWRPAQWDLVDPTYDILNSEIGIGPKVNLRPKVTGVEVTQHTYSHDTAVKTIVDEYKDIGSYEYRFPAPMWGYTLGGTIAGYIETGANHIIVHVTMAGDVVVTAKDVIHTSSKTAVYDTGIGSAKENIVVVDQATLISPLNGATVAQDLFDYYAKRLEKKAKLFAPVVHTGNSVLIDTLFGRQIRGIIENGTVNLTGGFTVDVDIIGIVEPEV